MEKLKNIIKYFLLNQQRSKSKCVELARVALFLYLVDWHSAVTQDKVITDIGWKVSKGTIQDSDEIENAVNDTAIFAIGEDKTIPLKIKNTIRCIDNTPTDVFSTDERNIFNRVIAISDERDITTLLIFALSTYPIISSTDELTSDILKKAGEYKKLKQDPQDKS